MTKPINIKIQKKNFEILLNRIKQLGNVFQDIYPRIVKLIGYNVSLNFEKKEDSTGLKWEQLSPDYLAKKLKIKGTDDILIWSGNLRRAASLVIGFLIGKYTLKVSMDSSGAPYGVLHQYGYKPKNIPQREFFYLSVQGTEDLKGLIESEFEKLAEVKSELS